MGMASMKTTLDIPEDVYRRAKMKAAAEGRKIKDVVTEGLLAVLRGTAGPAEGSPVPSAFEAMQDACLVRMAESTGLSICTLDSLFSVYRKHGRASLPLLCPDTTP